MSRVDERDFEFKFIKNRPAISGQGSPHLKHSNKKKIVCFFVGNDIRAPRLAIEFGKKFDIEVASSYDSIIAPSRLTSDYDNSKQRLASITDKHADMIFSCAVDQISYLSKRTEPFIYFYPDQNFSRNEAKFSNPSVFRIVHAPSSPVSKGTQLVRAAIAKAKKVGYRIEYIELIGVKNTVVLQELRAAHIVLNEFYALVPGVFGVEALASFCALMTAADETIEPDLPPGSNMAWLPTKSYEVYDNLKFLLDSPDRILNYAENGYAWALKYAAQSSSSHKLLKLLDSIST